MQLHRQRKEFILRSTSVWVISFGLEHMANHWVDETGVEFPVLLDADRVAYREYQLERSFRRSWNLPTIWRYVQLLASGRSWRGIQGDSTQLGGDFVIGADRTLRFAYYSRDPTDRPGLAEIMTVLPVPLVVSR